jgi:hypothetical protein
MSEAGIINNPLNHSVVFIKEADVVLTNVWKVAIHVDLAPYENSTEFVNNDLHEISVITRNTTQVEEIQRIKVEVRSLESKLQNVKECLPRADRRGLINVAGSAPKYLFGTATDTDLQGLQTTIDELRSKQDNIIHAANQQVTYLRQLDSAVKYDHNAISNLSEIIDYVVKTHEKFQKTVSRWEWVLKQQEALNAVKHKCEISCSRPINVTHYLCLIYRGKLNDCHSLPLIFTIILVNNIFIHPPLQCTASVQCVG